MIKQWVVFILDMKEIARYTLADEMEGEREATIGLLAYENGVSEEEILWKIV